MVDLGSGHGALGAGKADALEELLAVKLLAGAGLFDDERRGEDGALVGGETLSAFFTFAPAPDAPTRVVSGVEHPGIVILAIRTAQSTLLSVTDTRLRINHAMFGKTTPIYGGYRIDVPYIYAHNSSILADELQLSEGKLNLKIGTFSFYGKG